MNILKYQDYKDLLVWQRSMQLAKVIYLLINKLPKEEMYALSNQMRRAAVSIPSNIAEGQARNSNREFARFLSIARGSKAELQTQLLICVDIGYLLEEDINEAMSLAEEIGKMLSSLAQRMKITVDSVQ